MITLLHRSVLVLVLTLVAASATAQDALSVARELYAAAAYEDALVLLDGLRTAAEQPEESRTIEQYRAFCLLALGRAEDAEHAIEAMYAIDPTFVPATAELSPRLLSAFSDVRQRTVPDMLKRRYLEAKAAYSDEHYLDAAARFSEILGVLEHLDVEVLTSDPLLAELEVLSGGYRDLSLAAATPPPPPTPEPRPALPEPVVAVAPPTPPRPIVYGVEHRNVVPPIAEKQSLPQFQGRLATPGGGVLEAIINELGAVILAEMTTPINPTYDRLAVHAALAWQFRPAALDGVPVKYRKTIRIDIRR